MTKNPEWLELLDSPTTAPAWPTPLHSIVNGPSRFNPQPIPVQTQEKVKSIIILSLYNLYDDIKKNITVACDWINELSHILHVHLNLKFG